MEKFFVLIAIVRSSFHFIFLVGGTCLINMVIYDGSLQRRVSGIKSFRIGSCQMKVTYLINSIYRYAYLVGPPERLIKIDKLAVHLLSSR